jgi:hypothetical protein
MPATTEDLERIASEIHILHSHVEHEGRDRRLSKDYEHNPASSEAWISIARIQRLSRFSLPEKNKDGDLLRRPPKRLKT